MRRISFVIICWMLLLPLIVNADTKKTQKDLNEESIQAVLWYQKSAEMRALSYQAFNLARMVYDQDLKKNKSGKKRAVVVDIDETILDNSPFQAGLIGTNHKYNNVLWDIWCKSKKSRALPGSVDFLNYVHKNSGEVFYVSNRKSIKREIDLKDVTIENLKTLGFPINSDKHILFQTDSLESSKESRINSINEQYRIVLLIGDNLGDFDKIFETTNSDARNDAVIRHFSKFGTRFIMLPNPMYGSWERSLYDSRILSPQEISDTRKKLLSKFAGMTIPADKLSYYQKVKIKFEEAKTFIAEQKDELKKLNLSVSAGLNGHSAGENNLYKMNFSSSISKGVYPNEFRLTAGTDLQIIDNKLTENVTKLLINYDHHIFPWLECYGFIERFSNNYLSIQHRYEVGTGLKLEFDSGYCSSKSKKHLTFLDKIYTEENTQEKITEFKTAEHETITALKKKYALFSFGLAVTVFTEMEKASINSEIIDSNDDDSDQEDCETEEIDLDAEQRYRIVFRPSFKFRPNDTITLKGHIYFKQPLGKLHDNNRRDYRRDLMIKAEFAIPSFIKWAKAMSLELEYGNHYDNAPPEIPETKINEYIALGKELKTTVAENKHEEIKLKLAIKF